MQMMYKSQFQKCTLMTDFVVQSHVCVWCGVGVGVCVYTHFGNILNLTIN